MIGTNLANSSDTSKFLPDGVNPRPGGYVMRPTNRLSLFLLIILLLFTTVPAVNALAAGSNFDTAEEIYCDDPALSYSGEITSPAQEDYYKIYLVAGQVLTIDVDAEKIGSTLDSILEVFDSDGSSIGVSDDSKDVQEGSTPPISVDPYLEITAYVDGYYFLVISASTPGKGADTGNYFFLLKCSDPGQPTSQEFTWPVVVPNLLGATGSDTGSLINITPENAKSSLPFDLGVGPIADIEYQFSTLKIIAAVNDNSVSIVAIDPDSGAAIQTFSLVPEEGKVVPTVVALEAAENALYGVQIDDPSSEQFSLVHVTFNDSDSTTTLTHVYSFAWPVWSLAYHSVEKVIYGVASIASTSDLIKIHLEPELSVETAASAIPIVDEMDQPVNVVSLDFSHENVLFGVDLSGNLHEIDHTTGQATLIGEIDVSAEVSGLTFVVGEPPDVDPIKTICSSTLTSSASASSETAAPKLSRFKRKKNPLHRAIGLFKFQGIEGETVTLNVALEEEESAEAVVEESSVSGLKNSWLQNWQGKGRVFLGIRDSIPDLDFRERKKDQLPFGMSVTLPADGTYYVMLIRPLLRFYKTDYCLTLESDMPDSQAWESFDVAWPSDDSGDDTALTSAAEPEDVQKSTETLAGESADNGPVPVALSTTAIEPTIAPPEEPVVETPAETEPALVEVAVEEPVVVTPVEAEPPAEGADPEVGQTDGGDTTVEEPVVVTVDKPVVDTPVEVEPALVEVAVEEPVVVTPVEVEPALVEVAVEEPVVETPVEVEPALVVEVAVEEPVVVTPVGADPAADGSR
jgi:hypothetical protein